MADNEEGLAAASNAPPAEIRALYDAWVTGYEHDVLGWGYDAPVVGAKQLASLTDPAGTRVLDVGCGTGLTGAALANAGFGRIVGVDLSPDSLAHAERRGVYESTHEVDLTAGLPFDDRAFGALLCCGVLSYVPDVHAILDEFVRVVAPGGAVLFTQRTDLWVERETQAAIDGLVAAGRCTAEVSDPKPYLPMHPEFGDSVGIHYITLRRRSDSDAD